MKEGCGFAVSGRNQATTGIPVGEYNVRSTVTKQTDHQQYIYIYKNGSETGSETIS